jgi:hypothetical protein
MTTGCLAKQTLVAAAKVLEGFAVVVENAETVGSASPETSRTRRIVSTRRLRVIPISIGRQRHERRNERKVGSAPFAEELRIGELRRRRATR